MASLTREISPLGAGLATPAAVGTIGLPFCKINTKHRI